MGQQQSAQLSPPLLGRLVQGGERPLVRGVDARVVLDQQGGDVHVLDGGGGERRGGNGSGKVKGEEGRGMKRQPGGKDKREIVVVRRAK